MKKNYYFFLLVLFLILTIQQGVLAQNREIITEFEWVKNAGSIQNSQGLEKGNDIVIDKTGNIVAVGDFYNEALFDTINLFDGRGSYITRMNADGDYLWVNEIQNSICKAIAVDTNCNYYITGSFKETIQLGDITLIPSGGGGRDIFIAQIDSSGNFNWAEGVGMPGYYLDIPGDVFINDLGELFVTGSISGQGTAFFGDITFDLNQGTSQEIFIAKMGIDGSFVWVKTAGGFGNSSTYNDVATSVSGDTLGNVFVTGYYGVDATFGDTTIYSNDWDEDVFVTKVDADGNFIWVRSYGGLDKDKAFSIDVTKNGAIYVAGYFWSDFVFEDHTLTSFGDSDIFIFKISGEGTAKWIQNAGADDWDYGTCVTVKDDSTVYLNGWFRGLAQFGTEEVSSTKTGSLYNRDIFVSKIDSSGNFLYTKTAGNNHSDYGYSIAVQDSAIYFTGAIEGSAYFDDIYIETLGDEDIFIAKLVESTIDTTVGIYAVNNLANFNDIEIYSKSRSVHIGITSQLHSNIYLYNISGQLIKHREGVLGDNEIKIENTGIYIIKVISGDLHKTKKVFIY